jgi:hypothetical protein
VRQAPTVRQIGRGAVLVGFVAALLLGRAQPVTAECIFIPPLPKISMAIPTASELFVGEVVATKDGNRGDFTVRIDEVLRGPAKVGQTRHLDDIQANWPWTSYGGHASPGCIGLHARVGETVAIALDAAWPGGTVNRNGETWFQPRTIYNTMAIIGGSSREQYGSGGRQLFSLERLREMAAELPATDTLAAASPATAPTPDVPLVVLAAAGFVGGASAWRRTRAP